MDDCQSTYLTKLKRKKKKKNPGTSGAKIRQKRKTLKQRQHSQNTHTHTHERTAEERKEEVRGFGVLSNHGQLCHCHRRPTSSNQACKISYCFSFWCDIIIPPTLILFFFPFLFLIPSESASGPNSQSSSSSSSSWDRILLQACYLVIEWYTPLLIIFCCL